MRLWGDYVVSCIDSTEMFFWCYCKYKQGNVTPIKDKTKYKFELMMFREKVMASFGISKKSKKYQAHHLLPKCLFPDRRFDPDNGIPLNSEIHPILHKEFTNEELIIDPITPIIEVLDDIYKSISKGM